MIRNYFKIAWRNLKKHRLYSLINIIGLTVGIVSCLLIGVYVRHELSYDRFHENADRIVRITMDYNSADAPQKIAVTGSKVGPQFKRTFPAVEDYVRTYKSSNIINYNNQLFEEKSILYADSSFFKMLSFKLVHGDATTVLDAPNKIVITQTIAKKYFGDADPIGKVLKVGDKDFMVSGLAADVLSNSQIQFGFVLPFTNLSFGKTEKWWEANYITYLLLKNKDQIDPLQKQITGYMANISHTELKMDGSHYLTYHLEPLTSVHLHSDLPDSFEPAGSMMYIYILSVVAVLIMLIACVNYVNLAIAQSAGRGAEIGIRKVLGAAKQQLFNQFIGESLFIVGIAVLLAFGLAFSMLPLFNNISGKNLQPANLLDPVVLSLLIVLGLIIGFAAGSYPALILSSAKLAKVLKSGFSFSSGQSVRKPLITFQFVISVFLIISTVIILQQLSFVRNTNLGYNKSNVLVLPVDYKMQPQIESIKKQIAAVAGVQSIGAANNEPINVGWGDGISTKDGKSISVNALPMDEDFAQTMQLKIVAGRAFNHTDVLQTDTTNQYKNFHYTFMLNESAAKAMGWTAEEAIGKEISKGVTGKIVGVVKDFHFKSLHESISPLLIFLDHDQTRALFARVSGTNVGNTIKGIEAIWKENVPSRPFIYKFLDDDYDALYRTEQRTAGVFTTFSTLAILLACLGLFAVTAYAVVQRTKEIGIRKVLGANISSIILLVSKDFLWMVVIASIIASPLAWYVSYKWLQDFAYRIDIHWWVFVLAGAGSLIVAALTVGMQSLKAAMANPVDSLRSE